MWTLSLNHKRIERKGRMIENEKESLRISLFVTALAFVCVCIIYFVLTKLVIWLAFTFLHFDLSKYFEIVFVALFCLGSTAIMVLPIRSERWRDIE